MNSPRSLREAAILFILSLAVWILALPPARVSGAPGGQGAQVINGHDAVAGQVLVKFRVPPDLVEIHRTTDADRDQEISPATHVRLIHSRSHNTAALVAALAGRGDVEYAEPDYIVHATALPNDPFFGLLWGLLNTAQSIGGSQGLAGADIGATLAWNVTTGSRANAIGVVDTGIDYTHPDLAANVWAAPSAFTVTIAGTPVTCGAGTHGFNAITLACDPLDDNNHGTHVSGTIGAVGNNGVGVTGINWTASIIGAKFLDATGSGSTSGAINAIEFLIQAKSVFGATANVRVLSNSWGGGGFSQALLDEINKANTAGMLVVAAAGNAGTNNDVSPFYPANYAAANVVAVAATDNQDRLASFSNFGSTTVDLGAPGVNIASTIRGASYAYYSGTSMATPHVSGAAALVLSACTLDTVTLRNVLLANVDQIPSLTGLTVTGGRLNVYKAITACTNQVTPDFSVAATPSSRNVTAGSGATYTVTTAATGGFSAAIALKVGGLPSGATGSFAPSSVGAGAASTLTITTSSATPAGTYPLTVTGTSGSLVHTSSVTLVVNAPVAGDFSISASPSSRSVQRNRTTTFTVTVTMTAGFNEKVTFSATGFPGGTTGTFSPTSVTGSGTTTLTVRAGQTRGTRTVTITGSSPSKQHSTQVTITIG
jgi:subtilisin family serine protease